MQKVYYIIKKFNDEKTEYDLPTAVIEHCKSRHSGNAFKISLFAYNLLFDAYSTVYKKALTLDFLPSNKPISNGASVSVSHSKNVVAVCFVDGQENIGVDVQEVKGEFSGNLKKLLNDGVNTVVNDYVSWCKREAYIKANDLSMLTKKKIEFKGVTKTLELNGTYYAFALHCNNVVDFVEVKI